MIVGQKNWQTFKDKFSQASRVYHIRKNYKSATHGYSDSANYAQEIDAQMMAAYALQALENSTMEDKESITNLTSINLTLS